MGHSIQFLYAPLYIRIHSLRSLEVEIEHEPRLCFVEADPAAVLIEDEVHVLPRLFGANLEPLAKVLDVLVPL